MGIVVESQGVWFYILKAEPRPPNAPPPPPGSTPQFLRGGGVKIIAYFSLTVPCQFVDGFHGRITVGAGK